MEDTSSNVSLVNNVPSSPECAFEEAQSSHHHTSSVDDGAKEEMRVSGERPTLRVSIAHTPEKNVAWSFFIMAI